MSSSRHARSLVDDSEGAAAPPISPKQHQDPDLTETTLADESSNNAGQDSVPIAPSSPAPRAGLPSASSRRSRRSNRDVKNSVQPAQAAVRPGAVMEYYDKNNDNSDAAASAQSPDIPPRMEQTFEPAMTASASQLASSSDLEESTPSPRRNGRSRPGRDAKASVRRSGPAATVPGVVHEDAPSPREQQQQRSMADVKASMRRSTAVVPGVVHEMTPALADDSSTVAPPPPMRSAQPSMEDVKNAERQRRSGAITAHPGLLQENNPHGRMAVTSARSGPDHRSMADVAASVRRSGTASSIADSAASASGESRGSLEERIRRKEAREARRTLRTSRNNDTNSRNTTPTIDEKTTPVGAHSLSDDPAASKTMAGIVHVDSAPNGHKKEEEDVPKTAEQKLARMEQEDRQREAREEARRSKEMGDDDELYSPMNHSRDIMPGDAMVGRVSHGATATTMPMPVKDDPAVGATEEGKVGAFSGKEKDHGKFEKVGEENLAVAIAIDEDDDEYYEDERGFIVAAVEYDPNSKPPITKNRRFRLYCLLAVCIVVVAIVVGVLAAVMGGGSSKTVFLDPTSPPTFTEDTEYRNIFAAVVGDQVFEDGTAHAMAADWIINEDPMSLPLDADNLVQRYALAFLYFHFSAGGTKPWRSCNPPQEGETSECVLESLLFTGIDEEMKVQSTPGQTRWLSEENECEWAGVNCSGGPSVVALAIQGQQLSGSLPLEMQALSYLQSISLFINDITGTIPAEYSKLDHLIALELNFNQLTGTFPEELYADGAGRLLSIITGGNLLTGTVSTQIGLLTSLRGLHIFDNMLSGTMPTEVGNLEGLIFTRWNKNGLAGSIPAELFKSEYLKEMWLHENQLTGAIPSEIGVAVDMEDLRLQENMFSDSLPEELYNLERLESLIMFNNELTGTLSTRVGLLENIQQFIVANNSMTGTIPSEFDTLEDLSVLWVSNNLFEGPVPDSVCANFQDGVGDTHFLEADCLPLENPTTECPCCAACCNRETGECMNMF